MLTRKVGYEDYVCVPVASVFYHYVDDIVQGYFINYAIL